MSRGLGDVYKRQLCGVTVSGEKELISLILSLTEEKNEYEKIKDAFSSV